jgi:hypothetical protein
MFDKAWLRLGLLEEAGLRRLAQNSPRQGSLPVPPPENLLKIDFLEVHIRYSH